MASRKSTPARVCLVPFVERSLKRHGLASAGHTSAPLASPCLLMEQLRSEIRARFNRLHKRHQQINRRLQIVQIHGLIR